MIGLVAGTVPLPLSEVWAGLWHAHWTGAAIVRDLRAPRVLLAFLVGGSLGICGAALQAMIRNPLAEPYLLGLSSGAGLGAVIAIATRAAGPWAVPVAAFVGALAAVALVYRLSLVAGRRLDPHVLLLSGVVVGSFAGALMSAIMVLSDAPGVRNAFLWLLGGFGAASWQALAVFAAYAAIPVVILFYHARSLDLIALGDEPAHHLGAEVDRMRRVVYVCTALLTAASVATCGIIGFVGLVVPHAVRTSFRPLHRTLLPLVFLAGGCFLVLADVVSRTVGSTARAAGGGDHRAGRGAAVRPAASADARVILEARSGSVRYRHDRPLALDGVSCAVAARRAGGGGGSQRQRKDHAGSRTPGAGPAGRRVGAGGWASGSELVPPRTGANHRRRRAAGRNGVPAERGGDGDARPLRPSRRAGRTGRAGSRGGPVPRWSAAISSIWPSGRSILSPAASGSGCGWPARWPRSRERWC